MRARKTELTFTSPSLPFFPLPSLSQRLPGIYLLISNVLTLVVAQNPYIIIQFGFFTGWVYLRFVKIQEGAGGEFRGDRSETFAFTSWFPPIAQ